MSTPHTGAHQLSRLVQAGLIVGMLGLLRDVDYFTDALAVALACPGTPFAHAVRALAPGLPSL